MSGWDIHTFISFVFCFLIIILKLIKWFLLTNYIVIILQVVIENNRATGVLFDHNGLTYLVNARREVILSAGAVNTPKLLMLSGIGPEQHLRQFNVCKIHAFLILFVVSLWVFIIFQHIFKFFMSSVHLSVCMRFNFCKCIWISLKVIYIIGLNYRTFSLFNQKYVAFIFFPQGHTNEFHYLMIYEEKSFQCILMMLYYVKHNRVYVHNGTTLQVSLLIECIVFITKPSYSGKE